MDKIKSDHLKISIEEVPLLDDEDPHMETVPNITKSESEHSESDFFSVSVDIDNKAKNTAISTTSKHSLRAIELSTQILTNLSTTGRSMVYLADNAASSVYDLNYIGMREDRRLRRLNTEILNACARLEEDVSHVIRLLKDGANPNATCTGTYATACHLAAFKGHDAILKELLIRGASALSPDKKGATPLHLACWKGHSRCVSTLVRYYRRKTGQSSTAGGENFFNTEFTNFINKKSEATDDIVPDGVLDSFEHECEGLRLELPDIEAEATPLHVCSQNGHFKCFEILLENGAKINTKDSRGMTVLDVAGEHLLIQKPSIDDMKGFEEIVSRLVQLNALQTTMEEGNTNLNASTPLHVSIALSSIAALNTLLQYSIFPGTFDYDGETPFHVAIELENEKALQILATAYDGKFINVKNKYEFTPLASAVKKQWKNGVGIALAAGADVAIRNADGDTAVHLAADTGNFELLDELVKIDKHVNNMINNRGETAFFRTIASGNTRCVRALMCEGGSLQILSADGSTVLHRAAEKGLDDILFEILIIEREAKRRIINMCDKEGRTALHISAQVNSPKCCKYLLRYNADISTTCSFGIHREVSATHIACIEGHAEVLQVLINHNKEVVYTYTAAGWLPIHLAAKYGRRECIKILLESGADLSEYIRNDRYSKSAIQLLIENVSRPAIFIEEILYSQIKFNEYDINDKKCEIRVNYSVLIPKVTKQMAVINELLNTGNRYDQKKLLLHPLIESFLHLKWTALSPFFYLYVIMYILFVLALTVLSTGLYMYKIKDHDVPGYLNIRIWRYILWACIGLFIIQDIPYAKLTKSSLFNTEFITKFSAISLGILVSFANHEDEYSHWPRQVTTTAVLLAWTGLMFQLSRFPSLGNYVLMFSKVAANVTKVLLTFGFIIIGFSFSFMIQFRAQSPFGSPWEALVKTIVMMTSEFDYNSLFESDTDSQSLVVGRIVFIAFLLLASIVLMNLMVGLAVSDITDLEIQGQIKRLGQQAQFLNDFEDSHVRSYINYLPQSLNDRVYCGLQVKSQIVLHPENPVKDKSTLPKSIQESILKNAFEQKKNDDDEKLLNEMRNKIDDLHQVIINTNAAYGNNDTLEGKNDFEVQHSKIERDLRINHLEKNMNSMKSTLQDILKHLRKSD